MARSVQRSQKQILNTYNRHYELLQKHLKLKARQPKTVDAYSRAIRRIGEHFGYRIDDLNEDQIIDYFDQMLDAYSWNTVKLDLHGLKFYYAHVLRKPWSRIDLIKPPKVQRLPDIVTVEQAQAIFQATSVLSYRVFFFTVYSMGLRLGEGLRLQVGDIDADRQRVHVRDSKGNKDRLVPLPVVTLNLLRRFWTVHRNPVLLFPNRLGGVKAAPRAKTPLDRGGVQKTMRKVAIGCGIKKTSHRTVFATATLPI